MYYTNTKTNFPLGIRFRRNTRHIPVSELVYFPQLGIAYRTGILASAIL
jgi:hypothetical protein